MNNRSDEVHLGSTPTEPCAVNPMHTSRNGLTFQLISEPGGGLWVEIARIDGALIAFEPLRSDAADIFAFADQWVTDRLGEINPVQRCADCGLPVELINPHVVQRRQLNQAVEFHLWVEFAGDTYGEFDEEEGRYVRLALCVTCRNDLSRRHPWLGELLALPQNHRRIR